MLKIGRDENLREEPLKRGWRRRRTKQATQMHSLTLHVCTVTQTDILKLLLKELLSVHSALAVYIRKLDVGLGDCDWGGSGDNNTK
jgi:hypothetical protein